MTHTVLFVDDEQNVLNALARVVEDEPYTALFANSGAEAQAMFGTHDISVVVSDMRMPEQDGITVLRAARKALPDAVPIILSGYADIESIMQAINEGQVWRYITKPWEDNDLLLAIRNALDYFDQGRERKRLLLELKQKNEELNQMNELLEQKVAARTHELNARTEILNMILEDEPLEKILTQALDVLKTVSGARCAAIHVPFLDRCFAQSFDSKMCTITALGDKALATGTLQSNETIVAIPVSKGGTTLAAVVVTELENTTIETVAEQLARLNGLIGLALAHHKAAADAPKLLERLDELIEGME